MVELVIQAPPERVWEVLRDGWTYSDWVVGTAHMRDVDPSMTLIPEGLRATRVTMDERFTHGPLIGLGNKLGDLVPHGRNKEALRRLADLAERRAAAAGP